MKFSCSRFFASSRSKRGHKPFVAHQQFLHRIGKPICFWNWSIQPLNHLVFLVRHQSQNHHYTCNHNAKSWSCIAPRLCVFLNNKEWICWKRTLYSIKNTNHTQIRKNFWWVWSIALLIMWQPKIRSVNCVKNEKSRQIWCLISKSHDFDMYP